MNIKKIFLIVLSFNAAVFLLSITLSKAVLAEVGAKSLFIKYEEDTSQTSKSRPANKSNKVLAKSKKLHSLDIPSSKTRNDYVGLQYWIDLLEENGRSRRVTTSHNFRSGDSIKLQIKSKASGYLYVINQDITGKKTFLYPTKGQEARLIEPGVVYTIPARGAIRFDDVPGNEKLSIALAKYPIVQPESVSKTLNGTLKSSEQTLYSACASSKGMFVDDNNPNIDCLRKNYSAGTKGMFSEEDSRSTEPASYSVLPSYSLNEGKIMIVDFNLVHR